MKPFLSSKEFAEFVNEYCKSETDLRIGQTFCWTFNVTDGELFYCEDKETAYKLMLAYVVD